MNSEKKTAKNKIYDQIKIYFSRVKPEAFIRDPPN